MPRINAGKTFLGRSIHAGHDESKEILKDAEVRKAIRLLKSKGVTLDEIADVYGYYELLHERKQNIIHRNEDYYLPF